jgi:putative lipoprotein
LIVVLQVLLACSGTEKSPASQTEPPVTEQVTGVVMFRDRVGLTPEARLEVRIHDVSRADAPAIEIASIGVDDPGQSPIGFSIVYDPALIDERHTYSISARVYDRGQLIFVSDTMTPVLTRGAGRDVVVDVVRVSQNKLEKPTVSLEGTRWLLRNVYGQQILPQPEQPLPYFELDAAAGTVTGFAGCNRLTGRYSASGTSLDMNNLAVTMMSCPDGEAIETAFLKALAQIDAVLIEGETMRAYAADALIANFEAEVTGTPPIR